MNSIAHTKYFRLFTFSALFLAALITALCICHIRSDTYRFRRFADELFKSELERDTLSMHYTLAEPDKWGIDDTTVSLPVYSKEAQNASLQALSDNAAFLQEIDCAALPAAEQATYQILSDYLNTQYSGQSMSYYHEPLSPSSGVQSQIPILLAEYTFRTKQDVENYLTLLSQVPDYLEGIIVYEQEKSDAGMFMADYSAGKVINQCAVIMDEKELNQKTHFLMVSFEERLAELYDTGVINEEERLSYISENERILTTMLSPAYEKIADSLTLLMGNGGREGGLCSLPEGRAYYLYLLRKNTGSDKDIDSLKRLLLQQFQDDYEKLSAIYKDNTALFERIASDGWNDVLAGRSAEDMLAHLKQQILRDFPAFPVSAETVGAEGGVPACSVKTISPCLAEYTSPAFYLTPPIDDVSENSIYINPVNNLSGIRLYTTLAHEGYPGHLYQTVFYHLYQNHEDIHPIRNILYFGGYIEGWAFYVEMLSYEYAKEAAKDSASATLYEIERLDKSLQLGLYCLLDIAIHYDGVSYEEAASVLRQFGVGEQETIRSLYEYIAEEPTTYLKYYIGYLEILELKEKAKALWGSSYSDMEFHTLLLEAGPCNFHDIKIPTHVSGFYLSVLGVRESTSVNL